QVAVVVRIQIEDDVRSPAANEDKLVSTGFRGVAEDAIVDTAARAGHVRESPGGPKAFHRRPGTADWGFRASSPCPPVASPSSQTAMASGGTVLCPGGAAVGGAGSLLISSLSSFPGLKYGTFFGGTSTLSPVFGLRPFRGSRLRSRKLPNPRSSIFSPRCSASMMLRNTVSTITSECFLVRSDTRETSSTSSALVMLPPFIGNPRRLWALDFRLWNWPKA